MQIDIYDLVNKMVEFDGSDLHMKVGSKPTVRVHKELKDLDDHVLTEEDMEELAKFMMDQEQYKTFKAELELDFAFRVHGLGRFRTNAFVQRGTIAMAMRRVRTDIKTVDELGLPPVLDEICNTEKGIVFICGATNSGKSTTMSALVNKINKTKRKNIIIIEDPIEYLHQDIQAHISQREIGVDTNSFHNALRAVTREDPDIIVIGELRDAASFSAAITASETGHLVLCTLHSTGASKAVARILEFFPANQHEVVRYQLAGNLHAIIAQKLLPRKDRTGVAPAVEVMLATGMIRKMIRDNTMDKLTSAVEGGSEFGMQTFTQALIKLINEGTISLDTALLNAPNPEVLKMNMQGIYLDETRRILDRSLD